MQVLFDADILVFRCAFAAEYQTWFLKVGQNLMEFRYKKEAMDELDRLVPGKYSRQAGEDYELWSEPHLEPLSHAINNLNTLVSHCLERLEASEFDVRMFLSGGGPTFRHEIATTKPYKGNRNQLHRPTYEQEMRQYIISEWDTTIAEGEEADDLLGIEQTKLNPNSVIVSIDKDLDQIPGLHYNFMYDRAYTVSEQEAIKAFHMQLLTGDTTDNIPGLPGIGVGRATKALHGLNDPVEQMNEVWRMYQIHSGQEDPWKYLQEQGQLLHIRTTPGTMWEPEVKEPEDAWTSQDLSLY